MMKNLFDRTTPAIDFFCLNPTELLLLFHIHSNKFTFNNLTVCMFYCWAGNFVAESLNIHIFSMCNWIDHWTLQLVCNNLYLFLLVTSKKHTIGWIYYTSSRQAELRRRYIFYSSFQCFINKLLLLWCVAEHKSMQSYCFGKCFH